jgi:hypothetical protein
MSINFEELKNFLYDANANGYAAGGHEVEAQRPGFTEIDYQKGDWSFHDSYAGHYFAPGQEIVYFQNKPIWAMAYAGGMKFEFHGDESTTHESFVFLKKALIAMDPENPYRGPAEFTDGEWKYVSTLSGDVKDFIGNEKIFKDNELVFEQNFIGGIVVDK